MILDSSSLKRKQMHQSQNSGKQASKRHHYLPRHYLSGFTNTDKVFFIYDKKKDRVLPKPLSPDAMFFENNLNTMTHPKGSTSDFLEDLYTRIENTTNDSLDVIRMSKHTEAIDQRDKMNLFLFLLILHWRLPSNVGHAKRLSQSLFLSNGNMPYFKLTHKDGCDVSEEEKQVFRCQPEIEKVTKLVAPFAPLFTDGWAYGLNNWRFLYTRDSAYWVMVGDNPIVTLGDNDHDPNRCLSEFIFPISGRVVLANLNPPVGQLLPRDFIIQLNSAIIRRSKRFVACPQQRFLEAIIADYKLYLHHKKEECIISDTFNMLRH
jgi:Protein of unknown function (DUF4238)